MNVLLLFTQSYQYFIGSERQASAEIILYQIHVVLHVVAPPPTPATQPIP